MHRRISNFFMLMMNISMQNRILNMMMMFMLTMSLIMLMLMMIEVERNITERTAVPQVLGNVWKCNRGSTFLYIFCSIKQISIKAGMMTFLDICPMSHYMKDQILGHFLYTGKYLKFIDTSCIHNRWEAKETMVHALKNV